MVITYNGEKLRYSEDYFGEQVLWITNPSQISMEHMKFVGLTLFVYGPKYLSDSRGLRRNLAI